MGEQMPKENSNSQKSQKPPLIPLKEKVIEKKPEKRRNSAKTPVCTNYRPQSFDRLLHIEQPHPSQEQERSSSNTIELIN